MKRFFWVLVLLFWVLPVYAQDAAEPAAEDSTTALVFAGIGGAIALATLVTRFTKTDKDDAFVARLAGVFKSLKK